MRKVIEWFKKDLGSIDYEQRVKDILDENASLKKELSDIKALLANPCKTNEANLLKYQMISAPNKLNYILERIAIISARVNELESKNKL